MKRKLPKYVSAFFDRHGKERYRYRKGAISRSLPGPYNSPEFKEALKAAQKAEPIPKLEKRSGAGTVNDLVARYYASAAFQKPGAARQKVARGILESFRSEFGNDMVSGFRFDHIEAILLARSAKRRVGNRTVGGPVAAVNLHKQLKRLFRYAKKLGMIAGNPASEADGVQAPKTGGRHPWSEQEIAAYRKRHALGTKARLALEIMLWTGLRLGDAARFGRAHIKAGRVKYTQGKTGKELILPAAPWLIAAIEAMPMTGIETFIVTDYGKPFSANGLGNKMREWCDEAGLPQCTAHGLRKALARRAADQGATQQQLKAVGTWSNDAEVATYVAGADQAKLAEIALARIIAWDGGK
jgi:integrase